MGKKIKELYANKRVKIAIILAVVLLLIAVGALLLKSALRPSEPTSSATSTSSR